MENVFNVTKSYDDLFFKTIAGTPTPTHVIKVEKVIIQEEKYYIFNVIKVMVWWRILTVMWYCLQISGQAWGEQKKINKKVMEVK